MLGLSVEVIPQQQEQELAYLVPSCEAKKEIAWPFPVTSAEDVGAQILCKPEHLLMRLNRLHMPTFEPGSKNKGWILFSM